MVADKALGPATGDGESATQRCIATRDILPIGSVAPSQIQERMIKGLRAVFTVTARFTIGWAKTTKRNGQPIPADASDAIERSFVEVATVRQRLFIWLFGPDLRLFWPTEAITAP